MHDVGEMVPVAQEDVRQDLRAMFRGAIRASLAVFLEQEVETLVGAKWYARERGRDPRPPTIVNRSPERGRPPALGDPARSVGGAASGRGRNPRASADGNGRGMGQGSPRVQDAVGSCAERDPGRLE